jgi:site-specific recombinase XerD
MPKSKSRKKKTPKRVLALLECATPLTPRELRDHAMLAMLIGCGLRRGELLALRVQSIQQRRGALGRC